MADVSMIKSRLERIERQAGIKEDDDSTENS